MVHGVADGRRQIDAPERIGREVLDGLREDLVVADDREHVVGGIDCRAEQPDGVHRPDDARDGDEVADPERAQEYQERAGGEVGQQPAPGHADGDTAGGQQGREARGFNAEKAEDRDNKCDVEHEAHAGLEVACERGVDVLSRQRPAERSVRQAGSAIGRRARARWLRSASRPAAMSVVNGGGWSARGRPCVLQSGRRYGHFGVTPRFLNRNAVDVRGLLDALRRAAGAVARRGIDADQDRRVAGLRCLQRRGVLEGVRRHDAVVVIGGRDERGRDTSLPGLTLWIGE